MIRRPPGSTRTDTLVPYTMLFRSREVIAADIAEAASLGYRIRLVGVAEANGTGLFQRVHPHLVPLDHPLAHVAGSLNAVVAEGNFVGRLFFEGAGARSEERSVGKEWVSTCRSRWSPYH